MTSHQILCHYCAWSQKNGALNLQNLKMTGHEEKQWLEIAEPRKVANNVTLLRSLKIQD